MNMRRYWKLCRALSYGAITFGWLQAFEMLNFADIATSFLALLFSTLVAILFGGPSAFAT